MIVDDLFGDHLVAKTSKNWFHLNEFIVKLDVKPYIIEYFCGRMMQKHAGDNYGPYKWEKSGILANNGKC
ncbi:MAG: hypothetical protein BWY74_03135 [Firmicutes bacterium ADurb.Bin419]|nr:MAG: hypothetical protein BWY74_03135 [Firmicutes bacterium ADurb.Bin419]